MDHGIRRVAVLGAGVMGAGIAAHLANAGIELSGDKISDAASSNVTIGIILGLVVGKPLGVTLFTWVATRFGFELPPGMGWVQFLGMGAAAGIGFTVSIFVAGLAYTDDAITDLAKIGILVASILAAIVALVLLASSPSDEDSAEAS